MPPHDCSGFTGAYYFKNQEGEYVPIELKSIQIDSNDCYLYGYESLKDTGEVSISMKLTHRSERIVRKRIHAWARKVERIQRHERRKREKLRREKLRGVVQVEQTR